MKPTTFIFSGWAFPPESLEPLRKMMDFVDCAESPDQADVLLGWSMGGIRALLDPSPKPRILIASTARFCAQPPDWPGMPLANVRALRRQLERNPEAALDGFHRLCAGPDAPEEIVRARRNASLSLGRELLVHELDELARLDARPYLASLRAPIFMLHGSRDAVIPIESARATAALLSNVQLHVHPQSGHDLPLAHPEWVERVTRTFLNLMR